MRGFNQAADLAERTGTLLQIPVAEWLVYKEKETRSQKKLDARERKQNLKDAFQASYPVNGLRVYHGEYSRSNDRMSVGKWCRSRVFCDFVYGKYFIIVCNSM